MILVIAVAVLLGVSACATTSDGPLQLYQHNSGDIINVDVGETFEIYLEGDPTTQIHWVTPPDDEEILEQVGELEYDTDLTRPDAGERLRIRFRATQPGRTRLQLFYQHPRQRPASQDVLFEVWVVAEEE